MKRLGWILVLLGNLTAGAASAEISDNIVRIGLILAGCNRN